jgi:hypothetical protein
MTTSRRANMFKELMVEKEPYAKIGAKIAFNTMKYIEPSSSGSSPCKCKRAFGQVLIFELANQVTQASTRNPK